MNNSATKSKSTTKFTVELTSKELFIIQMSLEQFRDIDDSDYRKPVKVAEKLLDKLPDTGLKWNDVA